MFSICKKEIVQFFSSLTGYLAIIAFLFVNGLVLFVFENNIFEQGYCSLDMFFYLAPWILLLLIPAITMRSFADEIKSGTFEILQSLPIKKYEIIIGKFLGNYVVAILAILPTIIYVVCMQQLKADVGLDFGATIGSYLGIFLLAAIFIAIGICMSSLTNNTVVAFILSIVGCVLFYFGFKAIAQLKIFSGFLDYYIAMLGIDFHYATIRKGVIDLADILYFVLVVVFFSIITHRNLFRPK